MQKYLVTGGAGFIGSNIIKKILENGDFVRAVDNLATGRRENIEEFSGHANFEFMEGDLTDLETAKKSVKGMDIVLHEAAVPSVQRSVEDPLKSHHANITATLHMLIASKEEGIKKFVYASSSSIYGNNPQLPKKEDFPVLPISPYALNKYAGERYAQIFWQLYGLPTICLRYFNVFGPKQDPNSPYSAVIPKFISVALKGEELLMYGDGSQSRDFTFVDNVVAANLLAASSEKGFGEVFNIACGQQTTLNELVGFLQDITKTQIKITHQQNRVGDVMHSLADISKAREMLGYQPLVDFKEGLKKTVQWYEKP
ncbi:SDR family oxidoreductase [Candidatus Parcubacteria bacterium]|nr:SDR family oxidoreductase [Candidatus Parcubacteria bacterium]